jgi:multiple sugar transport system permease protein
MSVAAIPTAASRRGISRLKFTRGERRKLMIGLAFISPWLIGFFVFLIYPIYYSLKLSFTYYTGFGTPLDIGLDNYRMIIHDDLFWTSLVNTLYYTGLSIPIGMIVAMLLALAMNQNVKEIALYRAAFYLPSLLPLFAVSFIFIALLDPRRGIVSRFLSWFGVPTVDWFGDPDVAKIALVILAQFGAGQMALIYLAGLKAIPVSLYDAAEMDGAGMWRKFTNVTIPLMTPVILYNVILGISAGLQVFTQAYIITNGGPANATTFYVFYLYNNAFRYSQFGYASAMAWILFLVSFVLAILVFKIASKRVHYDLS